MDKNTKLSEAFWTMCTFTNGWFRQNKPNEGYMAVYEIRKNFLTKIKHAIDLWIEPDTHTLVVRVLTFDRSLSINDGEYSLRSEEIFLIEPSLDSPTFVADFPRPEALRGIPIDSVENLREVILSESFWLST